MPIITKSRGGSIYIPVNVFTPNFRIDINGINVTNYLINGNVTLPVLPVLASTSITLSNLNGQYLNLFNAGDNIEIWVDYGTSNPPSNKIFNGKIDNINYGLNARDGWIIYLEGRMAPQLKDIIINEQFNNTEISTAIKQIIDNYPVGISYTNVTGTSTNTTVTFRNVSVSKAISELLDRANQTGYIDTSLDLHTFTSGSIQNNTERVIFGNNLISCSRIGTDYDDVKNRVTVYGNSDNNMLLIKTEEDLDSQSALWRKDEVITDSSMDQMDEIQERVDIELSNKLVTTISGKLNSLGLPSLKPGDSIKVSIPYCNVNGYYTISSFTHHFSNAGFLTDSDVSKKRIKLADIFKERIDAEDGLRAYDNPNNLENSYRINFDESPAVVTVTDASIENGILTLTGTSGTCISDTYETDKNITKLELRVYGSYPDIENDTYQLSIDNGISWLTVSPGVLYTSTDGGIGQTYFENTSGKLLKIKINLNGDSTHKSLYEGITCIFT